MIGMVLAAGAGRRLRPHTDRLPKALVPVDGDTTILDIALQNLAAVDLRDVVIVVGFAAGEVADRQKALERQHGVRLTFVHNDKAEIWNNAYSMWTARELMSDGVLMVNGDTVHPVSVEETMLDARGPGVLIAVDTHKPLGAEEMKVQISPGGDLTRITKQMDPGTAYGEYIGVSLIEASAAPAVTDALKAAFEADHDHYYEDGYQDLVDRGGEIRTASIPAGTAWVEVDDLADLEKAREIACRY